jgi:hypothetical protein
LITHSEGNEIWYVLVIQMLRSAPCFFFSFCDPSRTSLQIWESSKLAD